METLAAMLRDSVQRHAERPAVWVDGMLLSYAELGERAFAVADQLQASRTPRCAVYASRHVSSYVAILGALLAGHTYVPLSPRYPAGRLRTVFTEADIGAVVLDEDVPAVAELITPEHVVVGRAQATASAHTNRNVQGPQDGAYLLFTSGSTGTPKGVCVSQQNVMAYLQNARALFQPTPEDRFTQLFDLSFDLSVHDMLLCWITGAALYCPAEGARTAPRSFVQKHKITFWFSTPSTVAFMNRMRMLRPDDLPSLRWSLFCGEALPLALASVWRKVASRSTLVNLYGPTEATIACTAFQMPQDADAWASLPPVVPIGEPFPDQHAAIMTPDGERVPDGEAGELCLAGSQVTAGYWRRPDLTAERFVDYAGRMYYRTGDRCVVGQHGLQFLGRLDRQVKISGHRIELQEIESVMRQAAGDSSIAVLAWPLDVDGSPRGLIGVTDGPPAQVKAIVAACQRQLPIYMTPLKIRVVKPWPLNVNGKTDYPALTRAVERLNDPA